jgi:hypothetical protein
VQRRAPKHNQASGSELALGLTDSRRKRPDATDTQRANEKQNAAELSSTQAAQ